MTRSLIIVKDSSSGMVPLEPVLVDEPKTRDFRISFAAVLSMQRFPGKETSEPNVDNTTSGNSKSFVCKHYCTIIIIIIIIIIFIIIIFITIITIIKRYCTIGL